MANLNSILFKGIIMTSEANYLLEQVQNAMNEIGAISEQSGSVNARLQCAREVIDVLYKNDYIGALIDLGFDGID